MFVATHPRTVSASKRTPCSACASEASRPATCETRWRNAARCKPSQHGRWRVEGPDLAGDEVTAVVVLENGVAVVTVF
jgi:hypothetical protein